MKRKSFGVFGRLLLPLCAAMLTLSFTAGPSLGKVVYEETFDGKLSGRVHGKARIVGTDGGYQGLTVDRSADEDYGALILPGSIISGLRGGKGTIEFWVQRKKASGYRWIMDPVLEMVNGDGKNYLTVYIQWEGDSYSESPSLFIDSSRWTSPSYDQNVWGDTIPLGFTPKVGEWVHVALSFGPVTGDNRVLVNGKEVGSILPRPGSAILKKGKKVGTFTGTGGRLDFSGVTEVRIGAEGEKWDKGNRYYLEHTVLDDLRFHDEVVTAFDLSRIGLGGGEAAIASLSHDGARIAGFSNRMVAGDTVTVTMEGTPAAEASFDVARLADFRGEIPVSWKGFGVYLEEITFFEEGQIDLGDVEEYRLYLSTEPIGGITEETPFVEDLEVEEQSYLIEGLEPDTPYYVAVMALMNDGTFLPVVEPMQGLPMTEVEGSPGVYEGTFTVDYKDVYPEAVVVGRLGSGETAATLTADEAFEIDARLNIEVATSPSELKADEESTSEITVTVTDANGEAVPDHEIRFVLATTSQYTGVVGGGSFTDEVGGSLKRDFRGETNLFGQVTATYTAGFAAKTAIIVARDMTSDDTGAGYVTTFINAAAELELEAVQEVAGKALGYSMVVTSSDEWLTADGESQARITALVTRNGIPVEGHRVGFSVSAGSGKIRTVRGETGDDGRALAVYTAGKKVGTVLIRAVNHTVGITASVQIELRSDAPAKIAVTVTPDTLPADGRSRADVLVLVTDINDNPNEGVEVEYEVAVGSGQLRDIDEVTDDDGESTAQYVAGRLPGKVTIEVTVRSTVPTEEEALAARDLAVSVPDSDFF